ncbi:hypothetical protein QBC35DRAFT_457014 [Podospora australis]|uniref:Uncharacterized protein n=1 Tax=Podospora australis TaxID=1536484 RepID=A0AAN7ABN8_9PEZI|nr:hypothetical protein QBC35DRAFT_457014 [Podospora australis]
MVELDSKPTNTNGHPSSDSSGHPVPPTAHRGCNSISSVKAGDGINTADTESIPREKIDGILEQMVIIVPCKDEKAKTIQKVIAGIPASCAVILVSNSSCQEGCYIHQKHAGAATAFKEVGVSELIDYKSNTIWNGKGEGMYLGIAMAHTYFPNRRYVGFIDADNEIAGSVNEYCRVYAAGFALSQSFARSTQEDVMVRICWGSKPKVKDGQIDFVPDGRCSRIINSVFNRLFASPNQDLSDFIATGNAGEHAITMDMALRSGMANGYAIEPYQLIEPLLQRESSRALAPLSLSNLNMMNRSPRKA